MSGARDKLIGEFQRSGISAAVVHQKRMAAFAAWTPEQIQQALWDAAACGERIGMERAARIAARRYQRTNGPLAVERQHGRDIAAAIRKARPRAPGDRVREG